MKEKWRIPFTILMLILLVTGAAPGFAISTPVGIALFAILWLTQGLCMWMATGCILPKLILVNLIPLWSKRVLAWTIKD
jgi:hypothetical protein